MNELERFTEQLRQTVGGLVESVRQLQEYKTTAQIHHSTLELMVGKIEEQAVDVIVNATGTSLAAGSGVDADIHRKAGPQLAAASRALAPCRVGDAVLTPGFRLPAPWVIHTVGPIYAGGYQDEAASLDQAYRSSLTLAVRSGLPHIALPSIGTGSYGYPTEEAAQIALGAVLEFIDGYRNSELLIRLVLSARTDFTIYDKVLRAFAQTDTASDVESDSESDDLDAAIDAAIDTDDDEIEPAAETDEQPWRYQSTTSATPQSAGVGAVAVESTELGEPDFVLTLEPETVLSVEPEPILSVEPMPILSIEAEPMLSVDLPVEMPVYYNPEQEDFALEEEQEEETFTLTQEERDAARGELEEALQGLEAVRAGFEEAQHQTAEDARTQHEETVAQFQAENAAAREAEESTEFDAAQDGDDGLDDDSLSDEGLGDDKAERNSSEPAEVQSETQVDPEIETASATNRDREKEAE